MESQPENYGLLGDSGFIHRISISSKRGDKKKNVSNVVIGDGGINGDAHANSERPVSLLPFESFRKVAHPDLDINPGDFAENITTKSLDFGKIQIGTIVYIGDQVKLEVIQLGKKCHNGCIIREKVGDCIMPREGVFARVINGGGITVGDTIKLGA
jgi:MOSC domain-containing protein YiiM